MQPLRTMRSYVTFSNNFLITLLGISAAYSLQFEFVKIQLQDNNYHYEIQFKLDPPFGLNFMLKLDRKFQLFLTKCQDRPSLSKVGP